MAMLRALLKALFSFLALAIGSGILVWVLYNELVERQPQYRRPILGQFGLVFVMLGAGFYWGRQALAYFRRREDRPAP